MRFPDVSQISPKAWLKLALFLIVASLFVVRVRSTFEYRRYTDAPDLFTGDEPKYLRMVQSLAEDGDLDISNFWGSKAWVNEMKKNIEASGTRRFAHLYIFGKSGDVYSLHLPGLAFLTYPGYVLDLLVDPPDSARSAKNLPFLPVRLRFTRLCLLIMGLLSCWLLFRLLQNLFLSPFLAAFLFLPLLFNSPFPRIAVQLYPDGPAFLFVLLALNGALSPFRGKGMNDFFFVLSLGFLPWLHQRYIPLGLSLYLVFLLYQRRRGTSPKHLLALSGLLAVLSIPYFYYFYDITGSFSPLSLSRAYGESFFHPVILPVGFFGQLLSTKDGLLWIYPWVLFFFAGVLLGFMKKRRLTASLLAVFLPYYLVCSGAFPWSGASAPVGRFAVALLPVYLIMAGLAIDDLFRAFSWKKIFFYGIGLALVLANRVFAFFHLEFGYAKTTSADARRIAVAVAFLIALGATFYLAQRLGGRPADRDAFEWFEP